MTKVNIILEACGELSHTYDPICFQTSFTGDMNELVWKLYSNDDWREVQVNRYKVVTVEIPHWMDEKSFLQNHISLKYAVAMTSAEFVGTLTQSQFQKFSQLSEKYQYFIGWLWNKNKKAKKENQFFKSIESQVWNWLNGNATWGLPLSENQWESATRFCPLYEAKQISNSTYWKHQYQ